MQLNFLYIVIYIFYRGKEAVQQFSVLYTYINYLGWYNIPKEKALFYYIKELILYSFNACVIILFLLYIRDKCNIEVDGKAKQYIQNLSPQQILEHVEDIHIAAFSRDICCDANQYILDLKPPANRYQLAATSSSAYILSFTTNNQVP